VHHTTKDALGDGITLEMWVGSQQIGRRQLQNGQSHSHIILVGNDTTLPKHIRVKSTLPDGLMPLAFKQNRSETEWQDTASSVKDRGTALLSEAVHVIGSSSINVRVHASKVEYRELWSGWKPCPSNIPVELILEVL
jgi:hypothetical protein